MAVLAHRTLKTHEFFSCNTPKKCSQRPWNHGIDVVKKCVLLQGDYIDK